MMITNKELDSNPKLNSLEIILDHPPALSTIPEAMKRGFDCEIEEENDGEWKIYLTKHKNKLTKVKDKNEKLKKVFTNHNNNVFICFWLLF